MDFQIQSLCGFTQMLNRVVLPWPVITRKQQKFNMFCISLLPCFCCLVQMWQINQVFNQQYRIICIHNTCSTYSHPNQYVCNITTRFFIHSSLNILSPGISYTLILLLENGMNRPHRWQSTEATKLSVLSCAIG